MIPQLPQHRSTQCLTQRHGVAVPAHSRVRSHNSRGRPRADGTVCVSYPRSPLRWQGRRAARGNVRARRPTGGRRLHAGGDGQRQPRRPVYRPGDRHQHQFDCRRHECNGRVRRRLPAHLSRRIHKLPTDWRIRRCTGASNRITVPPVSTPSVKAKLPWNRVLIVASFDHLNIAVFRRSSGSIRCPGTIASWWVVSGEIRPPWFDGVPRSSSPRTGRVVPSFDEVGRGGAAASDEHSNVERLTLNSS